MKYTLKTGRVPENLNIKEIIENSLSEKNKTYKKYVTEGMVYFLSLLCIDEDYPEHMIDNGFIILNDKVLQKVIGKGGKTSRTAEIKTILEENKIIERLSYKKKEKSYGFRLTEKFNTGYYDNVELSERITNVLNEINSGDTPEAITKDFIVYNGNKEYPHLVNQFNVNNFSVNHNLLRLFLLAVVDNSIVNFSNSKYSDYSYLSLFSYIGRLLKLIDKFEKKDINFNASENNHRFYNCLTNLPKVLRQFIFINGKEIGEVDMSACQVYIFASLLNTDFCNIENESEYNIRNIFPELNDTFERLTVLNLSNKVGNTNYILGEFFSDTNKVEIEKFSNFDFATNDFYTSLADNISKSNYSKDQPTQRKGNNQNNEISRDSVKKSIMNILFNNDEIQRDNSKINVGFKTIYPQVNSFITLFHTLYTSRGLALLLQRCEAFIVLEKATFNIIKKHPTVPIFTIHDCIITTMDNINLVENEMVKEIGNVTKKKVGVKSKQISFRNQSPNVDQINEILTKHRITSEVSLDKKLININESNIDLALKYLYGDCPEKLAEWQEKLKRSTQS
jgi:hypothetical protein